MDATNTEVEVPEAEVRRHEDYWLGFVRFMTVSAISLVILLLLMAYFLL